MSLSSSEILRDSLRKSQVINPKYSLRSFAKRLGVSAAMLSPILRGKSLPSLKMAEMIAPKLNMIDAEKKLFLTLVHAEHESNKLIRRDFYDNARKILNGLKRKVFSNVQMIEKTPWQMQMILECLRSVQKGKSLDEIIQMTAMNETELNSILDKMIEDGFIVKNSEDRFVSCHGPFLIKLPKGNFNLLQVYRGLLNSISEDLEMKKAETRNIGFEFIRISKSDLERILNLNEEFLDKIAAFAVQNESQFSEDKSDEVLVRVFSTVQSLGK